MLLTGVAGQTSFGQAAFVGIGAYATAFLTTRFGVVAVAQSRSPDSRSRCCSRCSSGFITLRMQGHYLPLATIAWGISLFYMFGNLEYPGRAIPGSPAYRRSACSASSCKDERYYYFLIWAHRARRALGDRQSARLAARPRDPRAGRPARDGGGLRRRRGRLKIVVFVYAALLACVSGWLYAHLQRFVNPTPFGLNQGIEYLFMAVVGGAGSVWGAVVGATLITLRSRCCRIGCP